MERTKGPVELASAAKTTVERNGKGPTGCFVLPRVQLKIAAATNAIAAISC